MPESRRLQRSSTDKYVAGVAGGFARYFGVDPLLFRIAFFVSVFFGGVGLIAYVAAVVFIPRDDGKPAFMENRSRVFTVAIIAALCIAGVSAVHPPTFVFGPALFGLALLAGAGVLLYRAVGGDLRDDPARIAARAVLALIVLIAGLGMATGIGIIAALGGGVAEAVIAIAGGLGLIAAGLLGGPRWLILPVVVLIMPLAVVNAADLNLRGGVGHRSYSPQTVAAVHPEYKLGAGRLEVDLRRLEVPEDGADVNLRIGMGEAIVRAPADACIATDASIGVGRADLSGPHDQGFDVDVVAPAHRGRVVHLQADVGVGHLDIEGACA
jgi:phage shock protein PspC (stress-responsive transcriptional regulator)